MPGASRGLRWLQHGLPGLLGRPLRASGGHRPPRQRSCGGVRGTPDGVAPEKIVAALVEGGVGVKEFTVTSPSLEDLFVSLTGEGFDVSG